MPEQLSFNFEKEDKKPPGKLVEAPCEYHFEDEDECNRCGNPFEGKGSCPQCMKNPKKVAYLERRQQKH